MLPDSRIDVVEFTISPLYIENGEEKIQISKEAVIKLRKFQEELLKKLGEEEEALIFLEAPTGSGKTLTLLLPLFCNQKGSKMFQGSIGVYPSKELVIDQFNTLSNFLEECGAEKISINEFFSKDDIDQNELEMIDSFLRIYELQLKDSRKLWLMLLVITSDTLDDLQKAFGKSSHLETLKKISEGISENIWLGVFPIIFTVPEFPFLMATSAYGRFEECGTWLYQVSKSLEEFIKYLSTELDHSAVIRKWVERRYRALKKREEYVFSKTYIVSLRSILQNLFKYVLFFDEAHSYRGLTLKTALAFLYIYLSHIESIKKVVISSATLGESKEFRELAEKLARDAFDIPTYTINARICDNRCENVIQIRKRTKVKVWFFETKVPPKIAIYALQSKAQSLMEEFLKNKPSCKRMVILDRVSYVFETANEVIKILGRNPNLRNVLKVDKPVCVTSYKIIPAGIGCKTPSQVTSLKNERLIIGNVAIAYGMDLKGMDLGLIYGKTVSDMIQKIGRIGRGSGEDEAEVWLILPYCRDYYEITRQQKGKTISYVEFIEYLKGIYPSERELSIWKHPVMTVKALVPVFAFITQIILATSTMAIMKSSSSGITIDEPIYKHLTRFIKFMEIILNGLSSGKLRELIDVLSNGLYLSEVGYFNFFSFRGGSQVTLKNDSGREESSLPVSARNWELRLDREKGGFFAEKFGKIYPAFQVERAERELLDGKVVSLNFLAEIMPKLQLIQFGSISSPRDRYNVCNILEMVKFNHSLKDAPVMLINAKNLGDGEKLILITLENCIPLKTSPRLPLISDISAVLYFF